MKNHIIFRNYRNLVELSKTPIFCSSGGPGEIFPWKWCLGMLFSEGDVLAPVPGAGRLRENVLLRSAGGAVTIE